jgi:hypothetical protein
MNSITLASYEPRDERRMRRASTPEGRKHQAGANGEHQGWDPDAPEEPKRVLLPEHAK